MRNIKAVVFKEMIHILRDRKTLIMVILMPVMQVMIYGFGVNTDVRHLRFADGPDEVHHMVVGRDELNRH